MTYAANFCTILGGFVLLRMFLNIFLWIFSRLFVSTRWSSYLGGQSASKRRWAVITGGTDGIGLEFGVQLARKGFNLVLVSRSMERLESARESIISQLPTERKARPKVELVSFDFNVSDAEQLNAMAKSVIMGTGKSARDIAVLVNNVGQSHAHPEFFEAVDPSAIDDIITINVLNTVRLTRALLPTIRAGVTKGCQALILNMGSFAGESPIPLLQVYSGSKAFLRSWSLALSSELSDSGVHVQLLNTYFVVSKMSKVRRSSLMVPTPAAYVRSVLSKAGTSFHCEPYWTHSVLAAIMTFLPESLLLFVNRRSMIAVRLAALRKAARISKAE